jgi:hypothetical protein
MNAIKYGSMACIFNLLEIEFGVSPGGVHKVSYTSLPEIHGWARADVQKSGIYEDRVMEGHQSNTVAEEVTCILLHNCRSVFPVYDVVGCPYLT